MPKRNPARHGLRTGLSLLSGLIRNLARASLLGEERQDNLAFLAH
jgi:hypothetical protein